jgi:hypothetical protein
VAHGSGEDAVGGGEQRHAAAVGERGGVEPGSCWLQLFALWWSFVVGVEAGRGQVVGQLSGGGSPKGVH